MMSGKSFTIPDELITPSEALLFATERIGLHWWFWDNRERRLSISPGLMELLGYTDEEYDPDEPSIYKNVHPGDAGKNRVLFQRLLNGETDLYEIEYRVKNRQGGWEWYYNRGNVLKRARDGKPLIVGGISMNISGRFSYLLSTAKPFALTEEDLVFAIIKDIPANERTEAALRESEKLYRTLFEAADDRIALMTRKGEFILTNSAFYKSIGYNREEFFHLDREKVIHPDDWGKIREMFRNLSISGPNSFEYRIRHKNGNWLDMSSKNVLIPAETREKDMILSITRDVTEQNRTLEELEIAKQKAEESDRLKSAFLANMSHEIRTPMNSIVGFSSLLVNPGLEESVREEYVQRIIRNSEVLLSLINDIIDLARLESGQLPLIYSRLDLATLIQEVRQYALEEIQRLGKAELEVFTELEEDGFEMETDGIRLAQVMRNLVSNAVKFTDKGHIKIGYRRRDDKKLLLFVEDTGIGIDPGDLDMIFEQFRQVDGSDTRQFGGTGLGLSICRNLVRMMGGRIRVESRKGKGSLFQVELPETNN